MAAVNNCKDILCLFDVDGTVTPARLVSVAQGLYYLWEWEVNLRGYVFKYYLKLIR